MKNLKYHRNPGVTRVLKTRSFKNFNSANFCDDLLRNADWRVVTDADDVDVACNAFNDIVNSFSNKHAPRVSHQVNNKSPP